MRVADEYDDDRLADADDALQADGDPDFDGAEPDPWLEPPPWWSLRGGVRWTLSPPVWRRWRRRSWYRRLPSLLRAARPAGTAKHRRTGRRFPVYRGRLGGRSWRIVTRPRGGLRREIVTILPDQEVAPDGCPIQDRTHLTDAKKRVKLPRIGPYALVLHQMAFSRGRDPTRYDTVIAHYAILPDGTILQLHPDAAYLNASNGFNKGSVAVEFAGNFPDTRGRCWKPATFGCHSLTAAQVHAGRCLVRHLIGKIGLTHILAHRQSNNMKENDPGPDIWYNVGQWAIDTLGLKDGGPGFKVGTGRPIPDAWRTWGRSPAGVQAIPR